MNDSQIVELFWERKESAIQEAQDRYGVYCAAIASHILNNREDVEECVSDAFLCAWNTIPPQRPELLSAFLGKLTRRYALRKLRENLAQKRGGGSVPEPFEEMENTLSANMDLDQILEAMDLSALIKAFLASLPDVDRRLFVCRYWYFDPVQEIAERFGFSEGKVKMRLKRTRDRLAEYLRREGYSV